MDSASFLSWLGTGTGVAELPLLVVVAHPDDEVIGLGAQLPRFRDATILHVTDGAPRDGRDAAMHDFADTGAYAAARLAELLAALDLAGIGTDRALGLGIPDQQAALNLPGLARRIAGIVAERCPAILVTHAYEGGHPDHDATAFAVHAALRLLTSPRPVLLEITCYHAGPDGVVLGRFLPAEDCDPAVITLSPQARALKQRMIGCFATQREVLAPFPTDSERLRLAPHYDFTRPPHPGRMHYENFPWGMTGEHFCRLAAQALQELRMGDAS